MPILLLCYGLMFQSSELIIEVDDPLTLGHDTVQFVDDGSIVAASQAKVYHFSADGNLIRSFGGKGKGPGEFVYPMIPRWNGDCYIVYDGVGAATSIFNAQGVFVRKVFIGFVSSIEVEGSRFFAAIMTDGDYDLSNRSPRRVIAELDPAVNELVKGAKFHVLSDGARVAHYNNTRHYVALKNDKMVVMGETEPILYSYSMKSSEPQLLKTKELGLYGWKQLEEWPNNLGEMQGQRMREFWYSWSRVKSVTAIKDGSFIVLYDVPDIEDPGEHFVGFATLDDEGRLLHKPGRVRGQYVGVRDGKIVTLNEDDSVILPRYILSYVDRQ